MSRWGALAALVGVGLLGVVLYQTDLREVASHLAHLSPSELLVLVSIYFLGRLGGVLSWLLTMKIDASLSWFVRLLRVHLIAGAVERVTPLAGMGGEPVKLAILNREYGVGLRAATASLALTRMTDLAAIVLFCLLGLATATSIAEAGDPLRRPAELALAFLLVSAVCAFALQRLRVLARVAPRMRLHLGVRARAVVDALVDVETEIYEAYSSRPARLSLSVAATFVEWMLEALLIWVCLGFLEIPVSVSTAVSIASFALAVRTAFFFVPADIGTQEAALVSICEVLVGLGGVGLAIAAVVRIGELLWTLTGATIGLPYLVGKRRERDG